MTIRVLRKRVDTYQHGDLRAAMIQAGLKLLGEGGARELSLRAAAQLAGVSHSAPYRHFRDKDALISAIAEEGFRLLAKRMQNEVAACPSTDVRERLRASGAGYLSFAMEHPAYFRTIFGGLVRGSESDRPDSLKQAATQAYSVLRDLVVDGVRRGQLRTADVDELSLAAWSMVHGLSMLILDGQVRGLSPGAPRCQRVGDTLLRFLETGLST